MTMYDDAGENDPRTESGIGYEQSRAQPIAGDDSTTDAEAAAMARRWRISQAFDDAEARAAREHDDEIEAIVDAAGRFWLRDETISNDAYLWTRAVTEVRQ